MCVGGGVCYNTLMNPLTLTALRCEYRLNPLGLTTPAPRLSWQLRATRKGERQSAFQILAASSEELLKRNVGDLWDTGKVGGEATIQMAYAGKPLRSRQRVFWKVRAWDRENHPTAWSPIAHWEQGLLSAADWGGAQWIRAPWPAPKDPYADDPAPLFSQSLRLPRGVKSARLSVTGLGYFEARINGKNVSEGALEPGWTHYQKRVFYRTFEVTRLLQRGENYLSILVGNGWWNPLPLAMFGGGVTLTRDLSTGRPRCLARLDIELTDGTRTTVVTDPSWQVVPSPIVFDNAYLGEVYDARREGKGVPEKAVLATEPVGALEAEPQPLIQVLETLTPVAVTPLKPDVWIVDLGVNFAGRVALSVPALPSGQKVHLRYGELLHKDGTLNPMTSVCGQIKGGTKERQGGTASSERPQIPAVQEDTFLSAGTPATFQPRFGFRGFRYVEVTGLTQKPELVAHRLGSGLESAGEFTCSDPLLNKIQEITRRTFLSNVFSVQSDCPHREKFGYGGDIVATRDAFLYNFDMAGFYTKVVQDYGDAQRPDGALPDTAPFVGLQYCGVGWGMAHPLLQAELLRFYGDTRVIEQQYAHTVRWLEWAQGRYPSFLVTEGLTDHEGLTQNSPQATVTLLYAECARIAARLAQALHRADEVTKWRALAEQISGAYLKAFPTPPPTQTSLAYALEYGTLDPARRKAILGQLVADVAKHDNHLTTGINGTKFLLDTLSREGRADVAAQVAQQKSFPSWGWMLEGGATTLWEHWAFSDNTFSHNHPMFGSVSAWFFAWLGGIQPEPDAIGCDRLALRPQFVPSLSHASATYRSIRGPITVAWKRVGGAVALEVTLPVGVSATLHLPDGSARPLESGKTQLRV